MSNRWQCYRFKLFWFMVLFQLVNKHILRNDIVHLHAWEYINLDLWITFIIYLLISFSIFNNENTWTINITLYFLFPYRCVYSFALPNMVTWRYSTVNLKHFSYKSLDLRNVKVYNKCNIMMGYFPGDILQFVRRVNTHPFVMFCSVKYLFVSVPWLCLVRR